MSSKRASSALALSILILAGAAGAENPGGDWLPAECADHRSELEEIRALRGSNPDAWAEYERAVRSAGEGDPVFVPHPYTENRDEILENFRHGYFEVFFKSTDDLDPADQSVYEALSEGHLEIRVHRVVNWSAHRCVAPRFTPYYYLLEMYDESGNEVARAVLHPSGLLSRFMHIRPTALPFPHPEDVPALLRSADLDMKARDAQLVTVNGLPSACPPEDPCLAFKSRDDLFLVNTGHNNPGVYRLDSPAERVSLSEFRRRQTGRGFLESLGEKEVETPLVSVGLGWIRATRLADIDLKTLDKTP